MSNIYLNLNRISSYLPLVFLLTLTSSETPDPSVCVPPDTITPGPTPKLPTLFSTRVECNILNKNYTTDVHEYYDSVNNRGALEQYELGMKAQTFYSYDTQEYITVFESQDHKPTECLVKSLSKSNNNYIFGLTTSSNGSERIYSVGGALRFGRTLRETYRGIRRVRGILADTFEACAYVADFNASAKITWYFSANNGWNTALGVNQVPLRCEVVGKVKVNDTYNYPFHHVYEFTDFRTDPISTRHFEIPRGTFCPNRKNTKPLPKLTDFFHFYAEIILPENRTIGYIMENYDMSINLVKYEYYPPADSPYASHLLTEVHDYNTGVSYLYDPMLGNCTCKSIQDMAVDAQQVDPTHVRIKTAEEFFRFNNASYHYVGERTVRGIKCNVWTALRHDWPPGVAEVSSTFEWYFAQPNVSESILGYTTMETRVPVMLQITAKTATTTRVYIYNMYDYDETQPLIWMFDVTPCFNYLHRKSFKLAFPGRYSEVVRVNADLFKYFFIMAVQDCTGVTPLRVSHVQIDYTQTNLLVSFILLDVPPISGDVKGHTAEVPLKTAVQKLTDSINKGTFSLYIVAPSLNKPLRMTGKPYSSSSWDTIVDENNKSPGNGYSSGVMGGTAVAVLLVSFILGFALLFGVYKARGGSFAGSFKPKKFDDDLPVIT